MRGRRTVTAARAALKGLVVGLLALAVAGSTLADPDLPGPFPNPELIPAGSLIIPMDNDKQALAGGPFNLKAYGLVNQLLWDEIPVKWAIRSGKAKDEVDFTAQAARIYPTPLAPATLDFRAGPFIVPPSHVGPALSRIAAFGNNVAVYQLTAAVTVDVRYTLQHKPKVAVLNDGGNAAIHRTALDAAGFVFGTHYDEISATTLTTINADSCFTVASEPHFDSSAAGPQVEAVREFLLSGGNFLAQCVAILSYENNAAFGLFQSTSGLADSDASTTDFLFPNADLAFSQFQGQLEDVGGSVGEYALAGGSTWTNNGHLVAQHNPAADRYKATAAKLGSATGGMVHYLGGHRYDSSTLTEANGLRMYLNAVLTPAARPPACQLDFVVEPEISGRVFEDINGDASAADAVGIAGIPVSLFEDSGNGQPDDSDALIATATTDASGHYRFTEVTPGTVYWVRVASTALTPSAGLNPAASIPEIWAEQTHGGFGMLCDDGAGGEAQLISAGTCFGGRDAERSDSPTTLAGSEHVAQVDLVFAARGVDFGFSYAVVVNTRDGDDNGPATPRTIQGSLHQFLDNANALAGIQTSMFRLPTSSSGYADGAFHIVPSLDLPEITDPVILDGATQTGYSGSPLVELDGSAGHNGLIVSAGPTVIRGLAINRFANAGIEIRAGSASRIEGNYIGTDPRGAVPLGNEKEGIKLRAPDTIIGGTTPAARNVVSGNLRQGIRLDAAATGTVVQGNYVGTDATGLLPLGNGDVGLLVSSVGNRIGGPTAAERNVISANLKAGVRIQNNADGNRIQGNYIGTDATGKADRGNRANGVIVVGSGNTVGGTTTGTGNVIAFNVGYGIAVTNNGTANSIRGNSIYSNTLLGIDLDADGITPNDPGDPDVGPNGLQNFPVLTYAEQRSATQTRVRGTLDGAANSTYALDFFASGAPDPSNHGEGERYLGSGALTTDGSGAGTFDFTLSSGVSDGEFLTATASSADGSTSEFSTAFSLLSISGVIYEDVDGDGSLADAKPRRDVDVRAYRDGGDGIPDGADDLFHQSTVTDGAGYYEVVGVTPGTYWITVDSRDVQPSEGLRGSATLADVWAEQTWGALGAWCDRGDTAGPILLTAAGTCFGGRRAYVADDFTALPTSEHLIEVAVGSSDVKGKDFGFSFRVITNTRDEVGAPQVQGSVRQFLVNSNALNGRQASVFRIPVSDPDYDRTGNGEYTVELRSPLPDVVDSVVFDGTTQPGSVDRPLIELSGRQVANGSGVRILAGPSVVRGFVINEFEEHGIELVADGENIITRNFIGTDAGGNSAKPNQGDGIHVVDSDKNQIGAAGASTGNVVSGNVGHGILISGSSSRQNNVLGNRIGTNATGDVSLPNRGDGLAVENGAHSNVIGGTQLTARNLISGNQGYGLRLSGVDTVDTRVLGNHIGTDAAGLAALPNVLGGIALLAGATKNQIGGLQPGEDNLVSGNNGAGILLEGAGTEGNQLLRNLIGVAADERSPLGNAHDGVLVDGASNNVIADNTVAANGDTGIHIRAATATSIYGNRIGTNSRGDNGLGNSDHGVLLEGATATIIGDVDSGLGNTIAHNSRNGVSIEQSGTGNRVIGNSIHDNGQLGIDLRGNGVTPNDSGDGDTGVNGLQNYPALVVAVSEGSQTVVSGILDSVPSASFDLHVYANQALDASGYGEGERYLGAHRVSTDASGMASFSVGFPVSLPEGGVVTVTATDAADNTSEFSGGKTVLSRECNVFADRDTWLDELDPAVNHGGDSELRTKNAAGQSRRAVLHYDLSGIPANASIAFARAWYFVRSAGDANKPIDIYRTTDNWTETGATWQNTANDYDSSTVHGSFVAGSNNTLVSTDITTLVQSWVDSTWPNQGLMLISTSNREARIGSRERPTAEERPCIEVAWTPPGGYRIEGRVLEDLNGDGDLTDGLPRPGVTVRLYKDDGDATPDDADGGSLDVQTDAAGSYSFEGLGTGPYWVVVDSRTVSPGAGYNAGLGPTDVWAEQTAGPARARCDDGAGGIATLAAAGPCHGGQRAEVSDDATWLKTSEHIAGVRLLAGAATGLDFGFSFETVVSARDADDDAGARTAQGSLRQFLLNANAVSGPQLSVFRIPASSPHFDGAVYSVRLGSPLPDLTDAVAVDGTTQPGFVDRPIIELDGSGAGAGANGLRLLAGGHTVRGLIINRFAGSGISIAGNGGNRIFGNHIGTDASGSTVLGNGAAGILIGDGSVDNVIGGTDPGAGNVISGNGWDGIDISRDTATGTVIVGNHIGTDAAGTSALPNAQEGIDCDAGRTTIGGSLPEARNVISGNGQSGMRVLADDSVVVGNYVGTDITGAVALPNGSGGVIVRGSRNRIGGPAPGEGNIISGNTGTGLSVSTGSANAIQGNRIGTDASGTSALANGGPGLLLNGAGDNLVGGADVAAGNVIASNAGGGIVVSGGAGNRILGNRIGSSADGSSALGNGADGIALSAGASRTSIGGSSAGESNTIVYNAGAGVRLLDAGTANTISRNVIRDNTGLGIDLGPAGPTANDDGDVDAGPNDLQNHPVLEAVGTEGATTVVRGKLNSTAGTAFTVELFANGAADPSGFGEGEEFVHAESVATDAAGQASFSIDLGTPVAAGRVLSGTATAADGSTSEFSAAVVVGGVADLALAKSVDDTTPEVGATIVFTLTVSNAGPSDAAGVTVGDLLPDGYTYVSDDGGGSYDSATGTWVVGSLAAGADATLAVTVTVNVAGDYTNVAEILTSDTLDVDSIPGNGIGNGEDDEALLALTPLGVADLSLTLDVDSTTPRVGENVVFTLSVDNGGPSAAGGIEVHDLLPDGYAYVSDDGGGSYDPVSGLWTLGPLPASGSMSLLITARVNPTGDYTNTAEIVAVSESDPDSAPGNGIGNGEDDEAALAITPVPVADLSLEKTVDETAPAVGQDVVFTLTLGNAGPSEATAIEVLDLLPDGYAYVSDDGGGSYQEATGVWTVSALPADGSATLAITATVLPAGDYANTAEVTASAETDPDSTPGNGIGNDEDDEAGQATTPFQVADLSLSKTVDNPGPLVGDSVVFTLTLTNDGPSDASGASVADLLPDGYTYLGHAGDGSYDPVTGAWTVGALAAMDSVTLEITAQVNPTGDYTNTADVAAADQSDPDSTPGNGAGNGEDDEAVAVTAPGGVADLSLSKTVDNPTPVVGENVVFTLTVANAGPSTATGVVVADRLPDGYTYLADDSGGGSYDPASGAWTVGALPATGFATLQITARVNPGGDYANTAQIAAADQADPDSTPGNGAGNGEDDEAFAVTGPAGVADLSLSLFVDNGTPLVGGDVVFTLTVRNAGPSDATGVTVADGLADGLIYVGDDGAGSYDPASGVWTVGALAADAVATLSVTATVAPSDDHAYEAQITASGQLDPDSTPGNGVGQGEDDEVVLAVAPVPVADLSLAKTVDNPSPDLGATVEFTLTVTNAGPSTATGVEVTDLLPDGYTYAGDDGAGAYSAATGRWAPGSIPPGGTAVLRITATVQPSGDYVNVAEITAAAELDPDSTPGNGVGNGEDDEAERETTRGAAADLSLDKTVDNAAPTVGSEVAFTLTVANAGPDDATGVEVIDLLPDGYDFLSDDGGGGYNPVVGIWSVGTVPAGATRQLRITASVNAVADYANRAEIGAANESDPDSTPGNGLGNGEDDEASQATIPRGLADLELTKTVDDPTPQVGQEVVFQLTVRNAGPSDAVSVTVADRLPDGYSWVGDDGGGAYDPLTGVWTIASLPAGSALSLSITATVRPSGEYANTAEITGVNEADPDSEPANGMGNGEDDEASQATTPNHAPAAADDATTAIAGTPRPVAVLDNDVDVDGDALALTTVQSPTEAGGTAAIDDNGTPGDPSDDRIVYTPPAAFIGVDRFTYTISDGHGGSATATVTVDVRPAEADLSLSLVVDDTTPRVGDAVSFTLTVTNGGPSDAAPVEIRSLLPDGYSHLDDDGGGGYDPGSGIWTVSDVPAGASASLVIRATVNPQGPYTLDAEIIASSIGDPDSTPGNGVGRGEDDESSVTTSPSAVADLSLAMSVDDPTPDLGSEVVFTLTVQNDGPSAATGVVVATRLPSGLIYVDDQVQGVDSDDTREKSDPGYDNASGLFTVGGLPAGGRATLSLTARVAPGGEYLNAAEVTAANETDPDSTPGNGVGMGEDDEASIAVTPAGDLPLVLTKAANKSEIVVGEVITYVVTLQNTQGVELSDVRVEDLIPAGFKYVEGSARLDGAPIDDPSGHRPLSFTIGLLPALVDSNGNGIADPDEPGHAELVYQLIAGSGVRPGSYENTATAANLCDGCAVSNSGSVDVDVQLDPVFDLATILGKVFEDHNADGWQDPDEPGVAGAMVALDDGTYALTDEHGRYHLPVVRPGQRLVKLNLQSLSPGTRATDGVRRVLWITPGVLVTANFGVLTESEQESIGRPGEAGLQVAARTEHDPVLVQGSAEALSVLVNDRRLELPGSEVRLGVRRLEEIVRISGGRLEQPVEFSLITDPTWTVERWTLDIVDGGGSLVRRFSADGAPPETLEWDGRTDTGQLVDAGEIYQYQLAVDHGAARSTSARRVFGVNRKSVIELALTGQAFETGKAELSEAAREALADAVAVLRDYPDERVVVEGHTDSVGGEDSNLELSRRRAESAATYLVQTLSFPADRVVLRWFGESRPLASNDLPEGREVNRRVELKADVEEVDRAQVADGYRGEPSVRINGESVELGGQGRFATEIDPGATELAVEIENSQGRSARASVPLPHLEIAAPTGTTILGRDGPTAACRLLGPTDGAAGTSGAAKAVCRLAGRTDAGNSLELDGRPLEPATDGSFATDLELVPGRNVFGFLVRNAAGYSRTAVLSVNLSDRDSDGGLIVVTEAIPNLTVNLPPRGVRLTSTTLTFTGRTDPGNRVAVNGEAVEVREDGSFLATAELPTGSSLLRIEAENAQGSRGAIEREVEVSRNQLFLVAFADAVAGQLSGDGFLEAAGLEEDDEFFVDGRLAFYLKGVIRGKYLISGAFDSGLEDNRPFFNDLDAEEAQRLLTNLDPDKLYPVYGDGSTVVYDVETQGKLYLALDSDTIHAVIGNFPLALTDTELAAYQRTLYGARFVYQSAGTTRFGDPDTQVVLFGAELEQSHVRDELRATGGSLYYLSHRDLIQGSEQVEIVVRDKNTGLVLTRQRQQQNADYTIKYPEGRLMFHRPISSVTQGGSLVERDMLAGNPVFIQVEYETRLDDFDKTATGGRVRQQIGDRVAVGGTYIEDETQGGAYELSGVDSEVRLGQNSRLVLEYAESTGSDSLAYVSEDGGLTYAAVNTAGVQEGQAWKAAVELDVGEWFSKPDRYRVNVYFKELDPGFFSSGNLLEQGTQKAGLNAELKLTGSDAVQLHYDREERSGSSLVSAASETTLGALRWDRTRERWGISTELFARDTEDSAGTLLDRSRFGAARYWRRLSKKLIGELQHQQTIDGPDNDQTTLGVQFEVLPSLALDVKGTTGDRGDSAQAGLVWTRGESQIYLTRRLAADQAARSESTVLGARSPIGKATQVYTEHQWEGTPSGNRAISLVGVQRQWDPTPGLRLLFSGELADVTADTDERDRKAVAVGVSYSDSDHLTIQSRNELRREDGTTDREQLFTFNQFDYKLNASLTLLARYRYSKTRDRTQDVTEAKLEERVLGLALRPVHNDRFNGLFRYTDLFDQRPVSGMRLESPGRRYEVFSLDTSYRIHRRLEWVTKNAFRSLEEQIADLPSPETTTFLAIQRFNVNIWKPIELGVEYRWLGQREADDRRQGFLTEASWLLHENFRLGVGYNFTDFSDDELSLNDYSVHGLFFRVQGLY